MGIFKAFKKALEVQKKHGYEYLYFMIDIHGTILKPTYSKEENYKYYPFAKSVLRLLSKSNQYKIILWSGCYDKPFLAYNNDLYKNGINIDYFNENPECKSNDYACFDKKFYFDIGLDDKFGFNPYIDWFVLWCLIKLNNHKLL